MMKTILCLALTLVSINALAADFKEMLIKAAQDKQNQEKAKELVKKGMDYFNEKKENKTEEAKGVSESTPKKF